MSRSPDELNPEEGVEEFLAAPDTVLRSETERRKHMARKAMLEAEERQLAASKTEGRPSDEDLLRDMIRVASDPDINPYWRFKTLSRKRYRLFGHYPIHWIDERWGQFEHAKQIAGLEDKPGTRQKKVALAEASRTGHALRYAERFILPHVNKHAELTREITSMKLMLSISDTHATFLDPFTWWTFLHCCRDLKPDVVYLNGDILEGSEISRFPQIPGWTIPLQLEFDFAREMLRQVRACAPEAKIIWGAGNHGLDRIARYLTQVAPAFANLRTMRFDRLAELDELDVQLAQGGTIVSPAGQEESPAGMLLYGFYRVHHGTELGRFPAEAELRKAGRSGQSGHVHRAMVYYGTTEADCTKTWMSTPMGCTERAGRSYIKGLTAGWQKGFGITFFHPGAVARHYPVITDNGVAIVEGYCYRRPSDLVDPDPSRNWLEGMGVPT